MHEDHVSCVMGHGSWVMGHGSWVMCHVSYVCVMCRVSMCDVSCHVWCHVSRVRYEVQLVAKLGHHKAEVWRVSWNMSGTMVASTGDDGVARLWKADYRGAWLPTLTAQPNLNFTASNGNNNSNNSTMTSNNAAAISSTSAHTIHHSHYGVQGGTSDFKQEMEG